MSRHGPKVEAIQKKNYRILTRLSLDLEPGSKAAIFTGMACVALCCSHRYGGSCPNDQDRIMLGGTRSLSTQDPAKKRLFDVYRAFRA